MSLTVVTAYFNPAHYDSRRANYHAFRDYMQACGVRLITVECTFGDDLMETPLGDDYIHVRAKAPLWLKENLLNIGMQQVKTPYVMWADADITFERHDWVAATCAALQDCYILQPWSQVYSQKDRGEPPSCDMSWCAKRHYNLLPLAQELPKGDGHPGYAWAAHTQRVCMAGGLLDFMIVGSADHTMAEALMGRAHEVNRGNVTKAYLDAIKEYQARIAPVYQQRIGFLEGTIHHAWHGRKHNRLYGDRHFITNREKFDPTGDLMKNEDAVYELVGKPDLQRQITEYFTQRLEDEQK